jgi:hypothetical protein
LTRHCDASGALPNASIVKLVALVAALAASTAQLRAQTPQLQIPARVSDDQIQASIKRGTAYLLSKLQYLNGGEASLAAMSLIKIGLPPDTPEIQAAIQKVAGRITGPKWVPVNLHFHIYEAGVTVMALANADPVRYRTQIETVVAYIIENQGPEGDWDYPQRETGDTSISQYAILGLWEANRIGIPIPKRVWDKAALWHITRQLPDGAFAYHPGIKGDHGVGTHTMTTAGIGSLHVCRLHLYPDSRDVDEVAQNQKKSRKGTQKKYGFLEPADAEPEPESPSSLIESDPTNFKPAARLSVIDRAISRGMAWLEPRFSAAPATSWKLYFLYGIERLSALANIREIGGHEWFEEGAAYLVTVQAANGSWSDQSGYEPATSFAVLFLSKATFKMLKRPPPTREPRFGSGLLVGGRGLPENLNDVQVDQGDVKIRKVRTPIDDLLTQLEQSTEGKLEETQTAIVEAIVLNDPEKLIGQKDRLRKLARDPRPEVRRTAFWALGRTSDLRIAPLLIEGLNDANLDCMVEARNALNYLSKKVIPIELPDQPTDAQRKTAVAAWRKWYLSVRPYDERDDLTDTSRP